MAVVRARPGASKMSGPRERRKAPRGGARRALGQTIPKEMNNLCESLRRGGTGDKLDDF